MMTDYNTCIKINISLNFVYTILYYYYYYYIFFYNIILCKMNKRKNITKMKSSFKGRVKV